MCGNNPPSCSLDLPLDVLNANLLSSLLIIVKPFAIAQINVRKLCSGLLAPCLPLALHESYDTDQFR